MADCCNCVHKKLCYEICELEYDYDDSTCSWCMSPTCPEKTECKYFTPVIDAAPMGHGRWMPVDIFGEDPYSCSECGNGVNVYGYVFCPHCGMPMTDEAIEILKKRKDSADNE